MEDVVMIDSAAVQGSEQTDDKKVKRPLKRKRVSLVLENMSAEERESRIEELNGELQSLVKYYKEVLCQKEHLKEVDAVSSSSSSNSLFACLLEERDLPYSKLVEEIYEKVKSRDGITLASVRSSVLFVGQRQMYGIGNADADVLEDDTEKCLWCWETRDLKLIPQIHRGVLNIRRTCRRKIHERINAVSGMISALEMPLIHSDSKTGLLKASQNLAKVSNEAGIREWVENMVQKNGTDMAEKEAKLKEKELMKELERKKREAEKEKRRTEKDKLQSEKELKRLQEEAEKEAKRREKEEAEMKKQLKKQQEEAEKEQRRREKEAADLRKQLALQKQATMMERLFKSKKSESGTKVDASPAKTVTLASSVERDDTPTAVTSPMDHALSLENALEAIDLCRSQFDDWIRLGRSTRAHRVRHWGMRQKPKTVLVKELKLQGSSSEAGDSAKVLSSDKGSGSHVELSIEKLVDGLEETVPDDKSCQNNGDCSQSGIRQCNRTKKLLQFDKSHRPAYYGTLSKKSDVIGPRHPFKMDPDLEYDIESDEEWEEEDPGESLSDCDKDEEEEILDEGNLRAEDEEGSEDGFFVPDGYLSENEGVQDSMEVDSIDGEARSSPGCKQEFENEEFRALLRQQKHVYNLTEHALKKNQPLIISNLMHEKLTLLTAEDLSGIPKLEQTFLQALSIRPFPGGPPLQISAESGREDDVQEVCPSERKSNPTHATHVAGLQDKDLPKFVQCIQSCPQGINKVVESLQQKFPTLPKSQLNRKVREISNFEDNRWQVKKEILDKLGLSVTPEKCGRRTKSIATFFSKRCLPPSDETTMKMDETSPQPCHKSKTLNNEHGCTKKLL